MGSHQRREPSYNASVPRLPAECDQQTRDQSNDFVNPNERHGFCVSKVRPLVIGRLRQMKCSPRCVIYERMWPHKRIQIFHPDEMDVGNHQSRCNSNDSQGVWARGRKKEGLNLIVEGSPRLNSGDAFRFKCQFVVVQGFASACFFGGSSPLPTEFGDSRIVSGSISIKRGSSNLQSSLRTWKEVGSDRSSRRSSTYWVWCE